LDVSSSQTTPFHAPGDFADEPGHIHQGVSLFGADRDGAGVGDEILLLRAGVRDGGAHGVVTRSNRPGHEHFSVAFPVVGCVGAESDADIEENPVRPDRSA
jgi:hypothetical protein